MQVVSADLISGKKVLLRFDIDVAIEDGKVIEDFRLKAGLPTLKLCLENAEQVIILGHIGRPEGREVPELSVEPIYDWLSENGFNSHLTNGKLKLLENLRFESGEEGCSDDYAKQLASYGDFYVNEAFAAHHKAASTTVLPTLLPHAAGLRFAKEVETLKGVRENPKKPLVVIIGGAKIEDKYPVISGAFNNSDVVKAFLSNIEHILVGGKIVAEKTFHDAVVHQNVMVGQLNDKGIDLDQETIDKWKEIIKGAKTIIWAGPVGKYEDPEGNYGNRELAQAVIDSGAESIIGGGDTITALKDYLDKFSFVSVGGGAMLKLLSDGTLLTIEVLE